MSHIGTKPKHLFIDYFANTAQSVVALEAQIAKECPGVGATFTLRGVILGLERFRAGKGTETRLELTEQEQLTLKTYKEWLLERGGIAADECTVMISWIRLAKEQAIDDQDFERACELRDYEKWALAAA